ncbi:hypothetical protein [Hymenobacter crusticola]|uniref:Uncharacterized protein n=1 Tax=Hymenobacter crusticola TaxID=1770526 RepID=A0A243WB31_9BACT|nr:hypothetical protein [Hymenobacter crusticola]OUJ72805.1 hypothetical protein BXP70_15935 [Hymenobacter crusticola]
MIDSRSKAFFSVMLLWLFYPDPLKAQQVMASTPLHLFFQANYDSTIIYQSSSSWYESPNYLIIAKQKERIYFFTYRSPYLGTAGVNYPGKLTTSFSKQEQRFRSTTPDTNRYFLPKAIVPATLLRSWQLVRPHQLWALKDDQASGQATNKCVVDDGDENTFYLIDRKAIKTASFYAPDFFEACLGTDLGRQQAIATRDLLRALQRSVIER